MRGIIGEPCRIQCRMAYAKEFRYNRSGHKKNRLSVRKRAFIIAVVVLAVIIAVTVYMQKNVSGILYAICEASVRSMTVQAVNDAVSETVSDAEYSSFVTITYDSEGRVSGLTANAQRVNLFARTTASASMAKISAAADKGVKVPLGAFTGIELFAGFGPEITFKVLSVGSVSSGFISSFSGAGINQTVHSVYLNVSAEVRVVLPAGAENVTAQTQVLVAETLIVGEVPDSFFGADLFGDGYRLTA